MKKIIVYSLVASATAAIVLTCCKGTAGGDSSIYGDNKVVAFYPKDAIRESVSDYPPTAEIMIDASGSMKPYFRASDNDMTNTIARIKNLNESGTKVYFLGNNKPYAGLIEKILGEINKQPNLAATTFHAFFRDAACKIDTADEIIYLVTDGIMSIGDGDMSKALIELQGKITNSLKNRPDLAAAILHYQGGYKGDYWNCRNKSVSARECPILKEEIKRPYYVIALGRKSAIRKLQNLKNEKLNNPQAFYMGVHDMEGHMASTVNVTKVDMNKNLSLILELPECMQNIEPTRVRVFNEGKDLNISVVKEGKILKAEIEPTTVLRPMADGKVKISFVLKNEIPSDWTETWNTENDLNGPDETTTYGLRYLVAGIHEGLEESEDFFVADFIYER